MPINVIINSDRYIKNDSLHKSKKMALHQDGKLLFSLNPPTKKYVLYA